MVLGSCFGVLEAYVDTGSRFGGPTWSSFGVQLASTWRPNGALRTRTGSTEAQAGSTEAQAGPAGQAGRPRRQSKGHRGPRKVGRPVGLECTRECMIYTVFFMIEFLSIKFHRSLAEASHARLLHRLLHNYRAEENPDCA